MPAYFVLTGMVRRPIQHTLCMPTTLSTPRETGWSQSSRDLCCARPLSHYAVRPGHGTRPERDAHKVYGAAALRVWSCSAGWVGGGGTGAVPEQEERDWEEEADVRCKCLLGAKRGL